MGDGEKALCEKIASSGALLVAFGAVCFFSSISKAAELFSAWVMGIGVMCILAAGVPLFVNWVFSEVRDDDNWL